MAQKQGMIRSAGTVGVMTLLSRVLGYVRDNLQASLLGAANASDAFIIAFRIPNLLRRLIAEGALTAAFVPTFSRYLHEQDPSKTWRFANRMFYTLLVLLVVITLFGIAFSPMVVKVLAYGFQVSSDKWDLTVSLNRVMFPYIFFISLAALASGIHNSLGSFALPAATPVLLNLSIIISALLLARHFPNPAYAFALGVLLGGLLQLLVQLPFLVRKGMTFRPEVSVTDPGVRKVGQLMLPRVFGAGITQINLIVDSQFASALVAGSVSYLYYAGRVTELTLGIFAISISTVILPTLSRLAAEGKSQEINSTLRTALRLISFVCLPAMVGLIVLRVPIISILFERGRFDADATYFTSGALAFYALGLLPFAGVHVLSAAYYAHQDTKTPVKIAVLTFFVHLGLIFWLRGPLLAGGIALSTSLSAVFNVCLLVVLFVRRWGSLWERTLGRCFLITSLGSSLVGVAAHFGGKIVWLEPNFPIWLRAGSLAVVILISAGVFLFVAYWTGSRELGEVLELLPRRPPRRS